MALSPLDQFRAAALEDAGLQRELRDCAGRPAFVARVIALARERGHAVEPDEVETALDATAKAWLLSWMQR